MSGKPKELLSTEEKAQITTLAADGRSPVRIGRVLERSPHTVRKYLSEPETQRQVTDEKAVLAEIYRGKARRIVESISEEDIAKASLQQKSISSGVLLDKSLLLAGDVPTFRVEILLAAVQEIRDQRRVQDDPRTLNQQAL